MGLVHEPIVVGTAFERWAPIDAQRRDFALARGDTWRLTQDDVVFNDERTLEEAGLVLRCTLKRYEDDPDPGLVQLDTALLGGITVGDDGLSYAIEFAAEVTELLPTGRLQYDVIADFATDESYTIAHGVIECTADVTRARTA